MNIWVLTLRIRKWCVFLFFHDFRLSLYPFLFWYPLIVENSLMLRGLSIIKLWYLLEFMIWSYRIGYYLRLPTISTYIVRISILTIENTMRWYSFDYFFWHFEPFYHVIFSDIFLGISCVFLLLFITIILLLFYIETTVLARLIPSAKWNCRSWFQVFCYQRIILIHGIGWLSMCRIIWMNIGNVLALDVIGCADDKWMFFGHVIAIDTILDGYVWVMFL